MEPVPLAQGTASTSAPSLFLMRHADHNGSELTEAGKSQTEEVASRFSDWLVLTGTCAGISIRLAPDIGSTATASEFLRQVNDRAEALGHTNPLLADVKPLFEAHEAARFASYARTSQYKTALANELDATGDQILVVANDPLISGLAADLLSRHRITNRRVAITKAELVCLTRSTSGNRWQLAWAISAADLAQEGALREKIKGKTSTATALGALMVGLLTFLIREIIGSHSNWWQWAALTCLVMAGVLYFATLFLYDTLQMPTRFWGATPYRRQSDGWFSSLLRGERLPLRPPSSTARVLHAAMVHVWVRVFIPATVLLGLGTVLLVAGAVPQPNDPAAGLDSWGAIALLTGAIALALGWVAIQRPIVGASD